MRPQEGHSVEVTEALIHKKDARARIGNIEFCIYVYTFKKTESGRKTVNDDDDGDEDDDGDDDDDGNVG